MAHVPNMLLTKSLCLWGYGGPPPCCSAGHVEVRRGCTCIFVVPVMRKMALPIDGFVKLNKSQVPEILASRKQKLKA
ncbi:hypothetical protein SISNIDRAFT_356292 [Sistotremastrum niveocremeum HHB9708]|uniref:Uncharacterized protein n=1 Tax=Sistotremastrum niveocremeum HHB9708 TaxID=1314777 RepID=A0A164WIJ3_9AGAM|nr:hypothetical protein SISNIDRAFT_356292 [Sistotremastrum niveocremeum HHB9708]